MSVKRPTQGSRPNMLYQRTAHRKVPTDPTRNISKQPYTQPEEKTWSESYHTTQVTNNGNSYQKTTTNQTASNSYQKLTAPQFGSTNKTCAEMGRLGQRMEGYVERLKNTRMMTNGPGAPWASQQDPEAVRYMEALEGVETLVSKLQNGYQSELDNIRQQLEDSYTEKIRLAAALVRRDKQLVELESWFRDWQGDLESISSSRTDTDSWRSQLDVLHPDPDLRKRVGLANRPRQQVHKVHFDPRTTGNAKTSELREKLSEAYDVIHGLETQIGQVSGTEYSRGGALLNRRPDMMGSEKKHLSDVAVLTKNIQGLLCQVGNDVMDKGKLERENIRMKQVLQQVLSKMGDLEGQLTDYYEENRELRADIGRQHSSAYYSPDDVQNKLRQLQQQMSLKVNDFLQSRDHLQSELSAYQSMVDSIETSIAPSGPPHRPLSASRARSAPRAPPHRQHGQQYGQQHGQHHGQQYGQQSRTQGWQDGGMVPYGQNETKCTRFAANTKLW